MCISGFYACVQICGGRMFILVGPLSIIHVSYKETSYFVGEILHNAEVTC